MILMHREIMNAQPGDHVDHIEHETYDNQKASLRICTPKQNMANQSVRVNNKSGFKGVSWHKQRKKWRTQVSANGKQKHIGLYATSKEAAVAYDIAALKYYGEFAVTNKSLGLLNE